MLASVIAASIVVRFGIIEAILRFYYLAGERPERVVSTGFASLFWGATAVALIALPFAGPISQALLRHTDAGLARLAILGLWTLTLYEFALTLLRLDERARAYFGITVANVLVTIPFTVWLIVVQGERASGILLGTFGDRCRVRGLDAVAQRRRLSLAPDCGLLRRMFRFGLPTMPAELSLYSLNFIDRIILVADSPGWPRRGCTRSRSSSRRGCRCSLAASSSPGRRSPTRSATTRRRGAPTRSIFTWFAALLAFAVIGLWLRVALDRAPARRAGLLRLAPGCGPAGHGHRPLRALPGDGRHPGTHGPHGVQLSGDDRRRGHQRGPQPGAGAIPWASSARGIALVASYVVVLVLMYAFTQRLFPVPYEWRRLALVVLSAAALVGAGEALLPTRDRRPRQPHRRSGSPTRRRCSRWGSSTRRSAFGLVASSAPSAIAARARSLQAAPGPAGAERASASRGSGPRSTRPPPATRTARGPDRGASAVALGGVEPAVVGLRGLAHPLAAGGAERLAGVEPVPAAVVAGDDHGGDGAGDVRPRPQEAASEGDRRASGAFACTCRGRGGTGPPAAAPAERSVASCSWWIARAAGTWRMRQPASRIRFWKSTSSE